MARDLDSRTAPVTHHCFRCVEFFRMPVSALGRSSIPWCQAVQMTAELIEGNCQHIGT